ncbi:MAG TPA: polysaccharide biosynthesis C-terminal domain-containing protein [Acidobacteriaceae bacterium]
MASATKSASGKILHNSFWYGLETVLEAIVFFGTSIAVARYLGPQKMGYFSYINFFVITVTRTSGSGLAGATRKYMSEFLALDRPGTAHAVYRLAYRYQLLGAVCISVLGVAGVAFFGEPGYKIMSCILILAIAPGIMSWVPAQANNAFEDVAPNTRSAFGYLVSYALVIFLTLFFHWDLIGIASATFVGRSVEVVLRTAPLNRKLRRLPLDILPTEIVQRIRRYCFQAIGVQLLMSVVWDRSELFFLRWFSTLEQVSFYSISFGMATNLLVIPRTFGPATGITLMVEASRDPSRVDSIVKNACRFLLFVALPVHLGAAAVARAAIGVAYGARYTAAIPVLIIASVLAIPRAFQEISEVLLRTADRQKELLTWLSVIGLVNITLDYVLIRRYGAIGAAWGNGLSQTLGIMVVWQQARRIYNFSFPVNSAVRLFSAAFIMAAFAFFICRAIPGLLGLIAAVAAAAPIYLMLVKLFRGLDASDRQRLKPIGNRLPGSMRRLYLATVGFITPAGA